MSSSFAGLTALSIAAFAFAEIPPLIREKMPMARSLARIAERDGPPTRDHPTFAISSMIFRAASPGETPSRSTWYAA